MRFTARSVIWSPWPDGPCATGCGAGWGFAALIPSAGFDPIVTTFDMIPLSCAAQPISAACGRSAVQTET
jgi:hypothetical protein